MDIGLGDKAKDIVTGFEGIVTGIVRYLTGCTQALLIPSVDKDGKLRDGQWFDVDRVKVLKRGAAKLAVTVAGPDIPAPVR